MKHIENHPEGGYFDDSPDYARLMAFELVARELTDHALEGDVAELGVYRGKFARVINSTFPESTLYLFDTFEGFDQQQAAREGADQDFSSTSLETVMAQMPFPNKVVPRKGLFPATFEGLEQHAFKFVSIDPDLYEPIRDGLAAFFPRLVPGGFIFVHDYNNMHYPGAKRAVREFAEANGVAYACLPDVCGTAVIQKPVRIPG